MSSPVLARPRPQYDAADLLTAYLPGSFYYSSPRGTLLADGVHAAVAAEPGASRAEAAARALADARAAGMVDPIVAGAVGFRPDDEASLVVPALVRRAPAPERTTAASAASAPARASRIVTPQSDLADYVEAVRKALLHIETGDIDKVVLARALDVTADAPVSVPPLLARLVHADPAAHAFAVDVTAPGDPAARTLFGASPELLISRRGRTVTVNPLAGSRPRSADDAENRRRIDDLRTAAKDRAEHELVIRQVADVLRPFCADLDVPEPEVVGTPTMWHLSTRITGTLAEPGDPASSSLALAEALHPTPAVCGVPTTTARDVIADLEPTRRGYYAGLVGWTAADGDGEWVVTIRCAEASGAAVRVHAGAGIVAGSDPDAELAETRAKFRTLLGALGVAE
ncbi:MULTISPECIES: isochorismate synthase [Prauserella salsuginis group]|uniref:isochorismate synthase n=1 Tax=Prauserella salsuginis TaxID=387889 RepID=A0ABW6G6V1_9PSEU|nr:MULTISPECIES: isochorismate synthase [Prauserella salsuginis group]MCR3722671.1 isochorismate synthase [Prauserella flava]MCR3737274.1 isochorismate synthase [Prauserella salsuginis]